MVFYCTDVVIVRCLGCDAKCDPQSCHLNLDSPWMGWLPFFGSPTDDAWNRARVEQINEHLTSSHPWAFADQSRDIILSNNNRGQYFNNFDFLMTSEYTVCFTAGFMLFRDCTDFMKSFINNLSARWQQYFKHYQQ